MKKSTQNIKTLCLHCFIILLFFAGTLGTVSATAKADEPVEEQTINIDVPKKLDQGVSNSANLAVRDMQVEKETNSAFLSKNIIPQFDNTVQELNCIPNGGSMWVNGPFMPEIAAEIQQELEQLGINSLVEARSYGEIDNCGAYFHQGVDFTITLQKTQFSIQSINQEVINNDILPILTTFGKPNLGNVTLVDSQGNVTPINTYDTFNNLQALDILSDAVFKKVYVIIYDPLLSNGQKLSEYELWNDNSVITQQTIDFFKQASSNKLNYNVVDTTIVTNGWPELTDGFSYTESNYLAVLAGQQTPHSPRGVNYNKIVNSAEFDICGKLNRGEIDEVWIYNGPWFGFYESTLVGPGAYFINSPPVNGPHGCNRLIPIMGPSVERTVHEAVHNFTHRTESIMTKVYGSWQQNNTSHSWDKFGLVKALSPNYSYSGCGSSHYPPNGAADYDYSNTSATLSNCNDFSNYPNLSDPLQVSQPVTCLIWDCTGLGYYGYWFSHFPQHPGCGPDNVSNDWWTYFTNPALALYPSNACLADIRIISGNVGIGSAILSYTDGVEKSVMSDIYGNYFLMVSNQWSGTVRPTKDGGYTFSPANREYGGTQSDLYNQDFLAALNGPEISIKGNNLIIFDGDTTPYSSDNTDFGIVAVTSGTVSHTFTISNIGPGDLNLTDSPRVIISGAHASDFSVTVQPVSPIAGSGSTTFTVVFDPSAGGVRSASISIANDDSNENPYNFSIQGTGDIYPEMDIKGNNISIVDGDSTPTITDYTNFGSTPVASGAISHTFTIYNTGAGNLNLTDSSRVIISGAHASDFSVTLQPSSPILPSGSASFTVVFDPTAGGLRTTSISIANDDPNENPYNFSIQGTGTTFPEIDIQGNNTSILDGDTSPSLTDYTDFGSAEATGGTVNRTFTIYNLGDGNLILTGSPSKVLVFGSSDFTVSVQPVSPIIPGGSTTFTIVFDPSLIGLSTASLNVYSDDSNENPYNFSVQGTTDRFSPDTQIESQPGSLNNDSTPTFTFSGNDGAGSGVASFMCRIDSGTYILCTSPFTSSVLFDGAHTFDVYAIDLANNADASPASYSWVLDTIAPNTTIITKPVSLDTNNTPTFIFSGNDGTGSGTGSFMCRMDSETYTLCTSPFTSSALSDGAHTFDVYAIDLANNADASPASYSWVLDATAPIVKFSSRVGTSPTSAASVNFIVTFSEPVTGVDTIAPFNDFVLTTSPGINGEFVTGVTPTSGTTYSVNVNTGSGNGTIRLDMVDNNSIVDAASNPLGGAAVGDGDFTTGQVYDIEKLPILTVVKAGTGGGTVTSSSAGINCGADCSEAYAYNTVITLNAAPSSDSMFDGWSGACSGTGSCVVTMIDAKSVTATFALKKFNNPSRWTTAFDLSHGWTVSQYVRTVGDVNNDGRDDLIGFGLDGVYVALSNGSGFGAVSKWSSSFDLSHGWTVADFVRTVGDVNNDGRDDLIGFGLDGVYVALSNGTSFDPISKWSSSFDLSHGWTVSQFVRTVGDVNNDGRDDLIGFGLDGVYVALSNGTSFGSISKWSSSFDLSHGWTVSQFVRTVGDVNFDGRDDLIGFGLDGVYVALSNGTSFDPVSKWSSSFDLSHGWTVAGFVRTVGDVNNDGRDDLIGFGQDGVYVALSNGASFDAVSRWTNDFDLSHGWTVSQYVRTVGDVNNDGKADLVGFGLDGVYIGTAK